MPDTKLFEMDVAADTFKEAEAFAENVARTFGLIIVQKIEHGPGGGNPCFIMEGPAEKIATVQEIWENGFDLTEVENGADY